MAEFVPNPLDHWGRLDTAHGANGSQIGALSPLFDTPEANQPAFHDATLANMVINREGNPNLANVAAEAAGIDPTEPVEGEVTNTKAPENQIMMGGSPVEPVEGSGPSGAPLTIQPGEGSDISDAASAKVTVSHADDDKNWNIAGMESINNEIRLRNSDGRIEMIPLGGSRPDLIQRLQNDDRSKADKALADKTTIDQIKTDAGITDTDITDTGITTA